MCKDQIFKTTKSSMISLGPFNNILAEMSCPSFGWDAIHLIHEFGSEGYAKFCWNHGNSPLPPSIITVKTSNGFASFHKLTRCL